VHLFNGLLVQCEVQLHSEGSDSPIYTKYALSGRL